MIAVLFWFGVIGAVREWRYARKIGAPIARREKWYLAVGLVLAFGVSLIGDSIGLTGLDGLFRTRATAGFWVAVALVVWSARQMILRRARSRDFVKHERTLFIL